MPQPQYISFLRHGEGTVKLPVNLTDAMFYGFALKCDGNKIQAFVDEILNRTTGGDLTYTFFGGHVLLAFVSAPHCTSPTEIIGWEGDHETLIFVPLLQRKRGELLPTLKFWVPYLLIDSGLGMSTGREVWGYNKTWGQMRVPAAPEDAAEFAAATMIYTTLNPDTQGQFVDLLRVNRSDQSKRGPLQPVWKTSEQILQAIDRELGHWVEVISGEVHHFLGLTLGISVPIVNLKQFRDENDNSLACYQALVDCKAQMTLLRGAGPLPGEYQLTVTPCESHQIEKDLGLTDPVAPGRYGVKFAFWVEMDFSNPPGERIWKAP